MIEVSSSFSRSVRMGIHAIPALVIALMMFGMGCGEPEPGGPGRVAGSRAGLDGSGQMPPPRIEFDSIEHDFGVIEEGQTASHRFSFRNRGQSLLFIRNVKPS